MPLLCIRPLRPIASNLRQLECSFHVGNCFLSLFVRVFRAPSRASGELIDNGMFDDQEQAPFLVEVQHREGDRLHFTALYSEIVQEFKVKMLSNWGNVRCVGFA